VLMSEATHASLPVDVELVEFQPMLLKGGLKHQTIYQLQIAVTTEA
jgi:hypothetical protein